MCDAVVVVGVVVIVVDDDDDDDFFWLGGRCSVFFRGSTRIRKLKRLEPIHHYHWHFH